MLALIFWGQAIVAGLTRKEQALWKKLASDCHKGDSLLLSWGYWGASQMQTGPRFRLQALRWEGDSGAQKAMKGVPLHKWHGKILTPSLLVDLPRNIQRTLAQKGYLSCTVGWARLYCTESGLCEGSLWIRAGPQVYLDTLLLRGKWPAPRSAFYHFSGLYPHQPLNFEKWEALPKRLRSNPYATLVDTPRLWLFPGLAWIELTLKPKNTNRLDGALSLLPSGSGPSPRPQLIGNIDVNLVSPLRLGEHLEIHFAQLPNNSQRLLLTAALPYLFKGTIEAKGKFLLWRQDTSFLTRESSIELRYRLSPVWTLRGGLLSMASRLLSTASYRDRVWPPPPVVDFQRQGLLLGWQYETTHNRIAPQTGWIVSLTGIQGRRGYLRNPNLPNLAYDRLPSVGRYQEIHLLAEKYTPIGNLLILRVGARGYRYWSKGFFENELYRLGGENSLRGFPENTFPVTGYLQGLAELRLRTEEDGFLSAFGEHTQALIFGQGVKPIYGTGIALQTRLAPGVFRVSFSIGQLAGTPWDLRKVLVSLSWISEF
ncbi:MAG: BamA/TamA family outer membrane protein [Bacteroidia bacterium]|nr:BamA/TamA family outer membrane protein [Bacteroidia bacterium]